MKQRITIIGGGIVGLAIAYKLSLRDKPYQIRLIEKESDVGLHQSGRNSGVLHCGLYYKPGSLKAQLAVDGIRQMTQFCRDFEIPHDLCGKVVVATDEMESERLDKLHINGQANGLSGLKFLSSNELAAREPHIRAMKSLLVPEEGIVDYKQVMHVLKAQAEARGVEFHFGAKVLGISNQPNGQNSTLHTSAGDFDTTYVVNCTGLFTDRMFTSLTQKKALLQIVPFRGEYLSFKPEYSDAINHLVYPVPDPSFPFLGVHFTRMISGEREVGPNAVLALKREGYARSDFSLRDAVESLTYPGLLRFVGQNFWFSLGELYSSISSTAFMKKAQKMMPDLNMEMLERGNAGVRAQAMERNGKLNMDFSVHREANQIHVLNAPSPGATASLAIADYIIKEHVNF